jgi:2-polyprenyl-3-methyl-5-hydroxy-6-metoxy-1,4-benzoquinol methylase
VLDGRSTAAEIMDDAAQGEAAFRAALRDLERINRVTLAYRPTLAFLDRVLRTTHATRLSLLDVGAGGGDMLRRIAAWGARRGVALDLAGLDRSPWAETHARAAATPARWFTCDLFELQEAERFDVVLCSLFAHHLPDSALVRFLRWIDRRARCAWLISDLHRHPIPFAAVWARVRLFRMDPMVVHDSTVSIARGFSRADWERLLAEAGVAAEVRWALPFRWSVSAIRGA